MLERKILPRTLVAILCVTTIAVSAEARQAAADYNSAAVEGTIEIKPDLYFVYGGGGNAVIRVTPEGLILVDTKNPDAEIAAALISEISAISDLPVRYVFNTHHHPDHIGNNQTFVDEGATVVGLERLKELWASDRRAGGIPGQPTVTFERDYSLSFGGAQIEAHYYVPGHTGADTIVYFPDLKFVMISDTVGYARPTPGINGTSAAEVLALYDGILNLDFDSALAGRGPVMTRAEIEAQRSKWETLLGRVEDAIAAGASRDNLMSRVNQGDLGWTFNEGFYGQLYDALQSN
jgi:cyclase